MTPFKSFDSVPFSWDRNIQVLSHGYHTTLGVSCEFIVSSTDLTHCLETMLVPLVQYNIILDEYHLNKIVTT